MLVALTLVLTALVTAVVARRWLDDAARVLCAVEEPVDTVTLESVERSTGALRDVVEDRARR